MEHSQKKTTINLRKQYTNYATTRKEKLVKIKVKKATMNEPFAILATGNNPHIVFYVHEHNASKLPPMKCWYSLLGHKIFYITNKDILTKMRNRSETIWKIGQIQ